MVLLLAGGTHTGKTVLAQRLLEQYHFPYLSIDHLKMGLIRSGRCSLAPESSDADLTVFLWPIVREMVKTAIENRQNLIVEGCYIPFNYRRDFENTYLPHLRYLCLIFTEEYVRTHLADIRSHANDVECRLMDNSWTAEALIAENRYNLAQCQQFGCDYLLIDDTYHVEVPL